MFCFNFLSKKEQDHFHIYLISYLFFVLDKFLKLCIILNISQRLVSILFFTLDIFLKMSKIISNEDFSFSLCGYYLL